MRWHIELGAPGQSQRQAKRSGQSQRHRPATLAWPYGRRLRGGVGSCQDACIESRIGFGTAMRARQRGGQGAFVGIQRFAWETGHDGNLARSLSIA